MVETQVGFEADKYPEDWCMLDILTFTDWLRFEVLILMFICDLVFRKWGSTVVAAVVVGLVCIEW